MIFIHYYIFIELENNEYVNNNKIHLIKGLIFYCWFMSAQLIGIISCDFCILLSRSPLIFNIIHKDRLTIVSEVHLNIWGGLSCRTPWTVVSGALVDTKPSPNTERCFTRTHVMSACISIWRASLTGRAYSWDATCSPKCVNSIVLNDRCCATSLNTCTAMSLSYLYHLFFFYGQEKREFGIDSSRPIQQLAEEPWICEKVKSGYFLSISNITGDKNTENLYKNHYLHSLRARYYNYGRSNSEESTSFFM